MIPDAKTTIGVHLVYLYNHFPRNTVSLRALFESVDRRGARWRTIRISATDAGSCRSLTDVYRLWVNRYFLRLVGRLSHITDNFHLRFEDALY